MKVKVYNSNLQSTEELDLNSKIFEIKPVVELVQQAIRVQRSNARKGTAHTKTRGKVRGGGKKPWKQKGTGNARAGSIRSPLWVGGGITFGPTSEKNYELKMNKKQWRKALFMTLSDKAATNNFLVFSEMVALDAPKTKEMKKFVDNVQKNLVSDAKKLLFVLPKKDEVVSKSVRNLKNAKVIQANSLNVVDIVNFDAVILPKASVEVIEKTYLK